MTTHLRKKWLTLFFLAITMVARAQQNPAGYLSTDSITTIASNQYQPNSFLRRLLMGENYRQAWSQPVTVPVFRFSQSRLTIKELGGGGQTKSLHLLDSQGREWSLRTVSKTINDGGLSPALRNAPGRKLSQDILSAGFPYATLLAGELAFAAGITAARVPVFFVAPDAALGQYESFFAGGLCTLEERDPGFDSTHTSEALYAALRSSSHSRVQQKVYLKARLLDLLMADWDRHSGNWRWGIKDSAGLTYWHAVPRDRDWAFYYSKGIVPWLVKTSGAMPYLFPFKEKLRNLKMASTKCTGMDQWLTNELSKADWETSVKELQASLNDQALQNATEVLPAAIRETYGQGFFQKLKRRRDDLLKEALAYYRFLAEEVVINGSDKEEVFSVEASGDEMLVNVYAAKNNQLIFHRRFSTHETYGVKLNGFGGNDVFLLTGDERCRIRLTVDGGEGQNRHRITGTLRSKISSSAADATLAANLTGAGSLSK